MKKRSIKIFGIGAVVFLLITALIPLSIAADEEPTTQPTTQPAVECDCEEPYDENGEFDPDKFWAWYDCMYPEYAPDNQDEDEDDEEEDEEEDEEDDEVPWWLEFLERFFEGMQGYTVGDGARGALQRIREERYWEEHPPQ